MSNTYTQLYTHLVFAVHGRENLVTENFRERIERYIGSIIASKKSKPIAIYANPDHTHIFLSLNPAIAVADLVREIKCNSARWINEQGFTQGKFHWQEGYGAFSYAKSQVEVVTNYVQNQKEHHKTKTFREEYVAFLDKFGVDYDDKYIFD